LLDENLIKNITGIGLRIQCTLNMTACLLMNIYSPFLPGFLWTLKVEATSM